MCVCVCVCVCARTHVCVCLCVCVCACVCIYIFMHMCLLPFYNYFHLMIDCIVHVLLHLILCPSLQAYGRDLAEAYEWCKKYKYTSNVKDLTQAWELYYHVFRRISKQLPQVGVHTLQHICCRMSMYILSSLANLRFHALSDASMVIRLIRLVYIMDMVVHTLYFITYSCL